MDVEMRISSSASTKNTRSRVKGTRGTSVGLRYTTLPMMRVTVVMAGDDEHRTSKRRTRNRVSHHDKTTTTTTAAAAAALMYHTNLPVEPEPRRHDVDAPERHGSSQVWPCRANADARRQQLLDALREANERRKRVAMMSPFLLFLPPLVLRRSCLPGCCC